MDKKYFPECVAFGTELVKTGDLDPVYIALQALPYKPKVRTTLAYSCIYHLGAAGTIGQEPGASFYYLLAKAAENANRDWPRGTERRHWRGKAAIEAVKWLRTHFPQPESCFNYWAWGKDQGKPPEPPVFAEVNARIREAESFGPWIAFKVADMMERVLSYPVNFADCELAFYDEPARGANLITTGNREKPAEPSVIREAVIQLLAKLRKWKAPPFYDRALNIQEAETILCKFKSHCNGHYPLGKDTREVYHGLTLPKFNCRNVRKMKELLEKRFQYWENLDAKNS